MSMRSGMKKRNNNRVSPFPGDISTALKDLNLENRHAGPKRNIVAEFDQYFRNENDLANWQRLCRDVGIEEDLDSKTQCRKALRDVWVNIYDLLDARANGTLPHRFPSEKALAKYTLKERRIYPKKKAKERPAVKALLAHIFGGG